MGHHHHLKDHVKAKLLLFQGWGLSDTVSIQSSTEGVYLPFSVKLVTVSDLIGARLHAEQTPRSSTRSIIFIFEPLHEKP